MSYSVADHRRRMKKYNEPETKIDNDTPSNWLDEPADIKTLILFFLGIDIINKWFR